MFKQIPGHPWAQCYITADPYYAARIVCRCLRCGDVWEHGCQHPGRAQTWIYRYAAQHSHGVEPMQSMFADAFAREQQRFAMQMRGW